MTQISFIFNNSKRHSRKIQELIELCQAQDDFKVLLNHTSRPKEAISFAYHNALDGIDVIVAVGGDGTINEVVNGIMFSPNRPYLAIIPNGTGNDFANELDFNFDFKAFIENVRKRHAQPMDIIEIRNKSKNFYFINICDIGFGGKVVEILENQRRLFGGRMSYPFAILRAFVSYKRPIIKCVMDDYTYEGEILLIALCNGSTFGDGLVISPNANPQDGIMEVAIFGKVSLWDYVKNLRKIKKGKFVEHPQVKYLRTKKVVVSSDDTAVTSEMDGEHLPLRNFEAEVLPLEISVIKY